MEIDKTKQFLQKSTSYRLLTKEDIESFKNSGEDRFKDENFIRTECEGLKVKKMIERIYELPENRLEEFKKYYGL